MITNTDFSHQQQENLTAKQNMNKEQFTHLKNTIENFSNDYKSVALTEAINSISLIISVLFLISLFLIEYNLWTVIYACMGLIIVFGMIPKLQNISANRAHNIINKHIHLINEAMPSSSSDYRFSIIKSSIVKANKYINGDIKYRLFENTNAESIISLKGYFKLTNKEKLLIKEKISVDLDKKDDIYAVNHDCYQIIKSITKNPIRIMSLMFLRIIFKSKKKDARLDVSGFTLTYIGVLTVIFVLSVINFTPNFRGIVSQEIIGTFYLITSLSFAWYLISTLKSKITIKIKNYIPNRVGFLKAAFAVDEYIFENNWDAIMDIYNGADSIKVSPFDFVALLVNIDEKRDPHNDFERILESSF